MIPQEMNEDTTKISNIDLTQVNTVSMSIDININNSNDSCWDSATKRILYTQIKYMHQITESPPFNLDKLKFYFVHWSIHLIRY